MAVTDTLINTLFDGRYRIVRRLGSGGMANVYLAEDEELGRQVAIKILNDRHASDDSFVERFRREAKNAAGLSHPNIVSIYDRGEAEGTYYIAMEYLEGRSLKDRIVAEGPLPIPAAIDATRQILHALGFAHRGGRPQGREAAQRAALAGRLRAALQGDGFRDLAHLGEPDDRGGLDRRDRAVPLARAGARRAGRPALGHLLRRDRALRAADRDASVHGRDAPRDRDEASLGDPEAPVGASPGGLADLDMVVLRALAKDPADRFESAEEMDRELARVASGTAVTAETADAATAVLAGAGLAESAPTMISRRPVVAPQPTRREDYYDYEPPRRSRKFWPWLLTGLLLVGALVAGFYVWQQIQDEINETKPVAVPFVEGVRAPVARRRIQDAGLRPVPRQESSDSVPQGIVIRQEPDAGERIQRGNAVRYFVSTGKPRVQVPEVVGARESDAVATLRSAGLVPRVVDIFSDEPEGTVIAQDPKGGTSIVEGSDVRLNVSKGPQRTGLPT